MARDAEQTRRKILDAATEEFARYGIAGARVDRITQAAGVNNALLYRYFGSKLELFDHVFGDLAARTVDDVPLDVTDLPAYVGHLYDYYAAHPQLLRLATWNELERPESPMTEKVRQTTAKKLAVISAAQVQGTLSDEFTAEELLGILTHLSLANSPGSPGAIWNVDSDRRREVTVQAARAILSPRDART